MGSLLSRPSYSLTLLARPALSHLSPTSLATSSSRVPAISPRLTSSRFPISFLRWCEGWVTGCRHSVLTCQVHQTRFRLARRKTTRSFPLSQAFLQVRSEEH